MKKLLTIGLMLAGQLSFAMERITITNYNFDSEQYFESIKNTERKPLPAPVKDDGDRVDLETFKSRIYGIGPVVSHYEAKTQYFYNIIQKKSELLGSSGSDDQGQFEPWFRQSICDGTNDKQGLAGSGWFGTQNGNQRNNSARYGWESKLLAGIVHSDNPELFKQLQAIDSDITLSSAQSEAAKCKIKHMFSLDTISKINEYQEQQDEFHRRPNEKMIWKVLPPVIEGAIGVGIAKYGFENQSEFCKNAGVNLVYLNLWHTKAIASNPHHKQLTPKEEAYASLYRLSLPVFSGVLTATCDTPGKILFAGSALFGAAQVKYASTPSALIGVKNKEAATILPTLKQRYDSSTGKCEKYSTITSDILA